MAQRTAVFTIDGHHRVFRDAEIDALFRTVERVSHGPRDAWLLTDGIGVFTEELERSTREVCDA